MNGYRYYFPTVMPAVGLPSSPQLAERTARSQQFHAGGLSDRRLPGAGTGSGPMSGFDRQHVDDAFFTGSTLKSNLLINMAIAQGIAASFMRACHVCP